jgi:aminoglycoside phosphotransferase (APT) family kinase protein
MHPDEIDTDVALVRRLLGGQFPQWADLAIDPVVSYGTDHDIYRLGDDLAVRLPRISLRMVRLPVVARRERQRHDR